MMNKVTLLAFILILVGIELDIFLPTLSIMQRDLSATETEITWTVTVNLIGLALSTFFYGSAADSTGRRFTILFGLLLFLAGSLGCYFASTFRSFLLARFVQGVGCGAPITICFTIVLDTFETKKASAVIGLLNGFVTGAMTIAPIIGVYISERFSWRANFAVLSFGALIALLLTLLFLEESLPYSQRKKWNFKQAFKGYLFILSSKQAWHIGMIPILMYSSLLVYLVNFPLIAIVSLTEISLIGYLQALVMFSFVIGSITVSYLIPRIDSRILSWFAYVLACGGGILLLFGSYLIPHLWIILTFFMSMVAVGTAFIISLYMGKSLDVFPELRGISTAVQGTLRLAISSLVVMLSGLIFNESFTAIAFLMCGCIFLSCLLCIKAPLPYQSG